MQPRPTFIEANGLAWQIGCSNNLLVIIAVIDRHIMLMSQEDGAKRNWRLGTYKDAAEARKRAVDMTSSYERHRAGQVYDPLAITLNGVLWDSTATGERELTPQIGEAIFAQVFSGMEPPPS